MFVHLYPDVDPSVVLPILTPFGPDLAGETCLFFEAVQTRYLLSYSIFNHSSTLCACAASYLQRIINTDAQSKHYEHDLAMLYLQAVLSNAKGVDDCTQKLADLVRNRLLL